MCVIMAIKLPRDRKSGKPLDGARWYLAKIRDRAYVPEIMPEWKHNNIENTYTVVMKDKNTDWREGISYNKKTGNYVTFVNSALSNSSDLKDKGTAKKKVKKQSNEKVKIERNGIIAQKALGYADLEKTKQCLKDEAFDGCTLITNGEKLFVIEMQIDPELKRQIGLDIIKQYGLDPEKDNEEIRRRVKKVLKTDGEIIVGEEEIKEDYIIVRTNHGVLEEGLGYTPEDGDNYKSSESRRKIMMKELKDNVFEQFDLVNLLSDLEYFKEEYKEKDYYERPLRIPKTTASKEGYEIPENRPNIFSTSATIMYGSDKEVSLFFCPIDCKFDDSLTVNNLIKERYANFVIMPRNLKIYESFGDRMNYLLNKI